MDHKGIVNVFRCCILTWDFLPVVLPAFLVAGAIAVFVPKDFIARYMGPRAKWWVSYPAATLGGVAISMCSCNIVPVAASIYARGAGIGPAFAFLFAAPAFNFVTTVWIFTVFGMKLGVWRAVSVPLIGIIIGMVMHCLFRKEQASRVSEAGQTLDQEFASGMGTTEDPKYGLHTGLLFAGLFGILILGARGIPPTLKISSIALLGLGLAFAVPAWFPSSQIKKWMGETWYYLRIVLPILLPAVFVIGLLQNNAWGWIYKNIYPLVGQNGAKDTFIAAVFGSIMYFPILTEVPFTKALLKDSIMGVGPALALLINGPGVSLPGAILIGRVFGWRKAVLYEVMEMLLGGTVGLLFGKIHGDYTCPCQKGAVETFLEEPSSMKAAAVLLACILLGWWLTARRGRAPALVGPQAAAIEPFTSSEPKDAPV